jgi:hypothetical protein
MDQTPRGATVVVRGDKGLSLEHPTFELTLPGGKRTTFDATRVRIGAGPGNDLKLDDPTVSAVHLEIVASPRGFRVKDLESTNGTRLEGVRIKEAILEDGQTPSCTAPSARARPCARSSLGSNGLPAPTPRS